jgi:hypothetical protein
MRTPIFYKLGLVIAVTALAGGVSASTFTVGASGKTVLMYDASHGNQVEFYDKDGNCFLWYPGNTVPVRGRWEARGDQICFQYGPNTYNPVTRERGGHWDCAPVATWSVHVVDTVPGDVFGLSTKLPAKLPAQPKFDSVAQLKRATP